MKIIIALLIFGVIVFVHEFGHFLLAKANRVCVEEFDIGMGPKLLSHKKGDTLYCLRVLPLGGACIMKGEDNGDNDEGSLNSKSVWARIAVISAGAVFNFLLAILLAVVLISLVGADVPKVVDVKKNSAASEAGLEKGDVITRYGSGHIRVGREIFLEEYFHGGNSDPVHITYRRHGKVRETDLIPEKVSKYMLGISYSNDKNPCKITVTKGGALEKAGFKDDDVITEINGSSIKSGEDFYRYVDSHPLDSSKVDITVSRRGRKVEASVEPVKQESYETGLTYNSNYKNVNEKVNPLKTVLYSLYEIRYQVKTVVMSLKQLFMGKLSLDAFTGPVGIVDMVGDVYTESASYGALMVIESLMSFTIMLSANLGVMNLLPLPALDGGRLLFLFIELIRGKKVDPEKEGLVHFIGFVLLMVLMVAVMFNDIKRLF